jgi:CHAT domain-containing protein
VPQQELFLFPLHATPFIPLKVPFSNEFVYPIERYTICYAPSIQIYDRLTQKRAQSPVNRNALFVENPDGDLKFALSQQEWVANKLHERGFSLTRLSNAEITRENVLVHFKRSGLIHYYGHGKYNWTFPEKSGLKMFLPYGFLHKITGNTLLLTAATIEEQASFEQTQLVVLSACETGLTDVYNTHSRDQFVGLPASFIQAGAQAVIGSLWTVPDPETSLLFSRFYHELLDDKESISPAEALRRAQLWMLKANFKEIDKAAKTHLGLKNYKNHAKKKKLKDPWSHPESWGGFYIVGDGFPKFIQ